MENEEDDEDDDISELKNELCFWQIQFIFAFSLARAANFDHQSPGPIGLHNYY